MYVWDVFCVVIGQIFFLRYLCDFEAYEIQDPRGVVEATGGLQGGWGEASINEGAIDLEI